MGDKQNGPFQLSFDAVKGCYPKSVVALDALWMLELASQRRFRERARCGVSAPLNPRNVDGAGFFGSLRRNAESSKRPEPAPGANRPPILRSPGTSGTPGGTVGPHTGRSRRQGRSRTHNSLIERYLSPITLLGQEPFEGRFPGIAGHLRRRPDRGARVR